MKTSIVIPAYNGITFLKANLPQVIKLGADETVIIDDSSTDGSADFVSNTYPDIKLIRHTKNLGFTKSVNDGFSQSTGEVVFLLNQDVLPAPDLIKKTLPNFKDTNLFAVSFNENDSEYSYSIISWQGGLLNFTSGPKAILSHPSAWASGGSAAFNRSLWNRLGGFDPIFSPGYYEDLDLGLTATSKGYSIVWDPGAKVIHARETSFKKEFTPKRLQIIKDRNYLLVQWKHLPSDQRIEHMGAILNRVIRHPGFMVPLFQAIWRWLTQKYQ